MTASPANNVTEAIYSRMGRGLHVTPGHPLSTLREAIERHFSENESSGHFQFYRDLSPIVTVQQNFDEVLVPADHVSRRPDDTYYVDESHVLRCHTSAHQAELLRRGGRAFLAAGDVYRRDTIDATHYPVFHQMEGLRVYDESELRSGVAAARRAAGDEAGAAALEGGSADFTDAEATAFVESELKRTLESLARSLFGDVEMRWIDATFPFTDPSFELEIFFENKWLEVLGCGVTIQSIVDDNLDKDDAAAAAGAPAPGRTRAWAFGLGLERLAMVRFNIPDIRLFWSSDERFLSQFRSGSLDARFKPFSKHPPCFKDVAFWVGPKFTENSLCEVVRNVAGDLAEEVALVDSFEHPKTHKKSECFRITYRAMDRTLTDDEVNTLQENVRNAIAQQLDVQLR